MGSSGPLYCSLRLGSVVGTLGDFLPLDEHNRQLEQTGRVRIKGSRIGADNSSPISLFYHLPLTSLFTLRQRRCCSPKISSQYSSPSQQSVSMDPPPGSRSESMSHATITTISRSDKWWGRAPNPPLPLRSATMTSFAAAPTTIIMRATMSARCRRTHPSTPNILRLSSVPSTGESKFLFSVFCCFTEAFFLTLPRCGYVTGTTTAKEILEICGRTGTLATSKTSFPRSGVIKLATKPALVMSPSDSSDLTQRLTVTAWGCSSPQEVLARVVKCLTYTCVVYVSVHLAIFRNAQRLHF